jgi:hypothetical protein
MKEEVAKGLKRGDEIFFAGSFYPVAEVKEFPHGIMVGVYDEQTHTNHIDWLNPSSLREVLPCYNCQGGGCPVCGGFGRIVQ